MVDAYDFVDANQLQNSGVYSTVYGETVVVAGLFNSSNDAMSVIDQLPLELKALKPKLISVKETKLEMVSISRESILSSEG